MTTKVRDLNSVRSDLKHTQRMIAVNQWQIEESTDNKEIAQLNLELQMLEDDWDKLKSEYFEMTGEEL
jgi:predicted  nucleic acid-binding Zn-ribbon protein